MNYCTLYPVYMILLKVSIIFHNDENIEPNVRASMQCALTETDALINVSSIQ